MKPTIDPIVAKLSRIAEICGLTAYQIAAASGTSPSTVERALLRGDLPGRTWPRRALLAFVAANEYATCRAQVRFIDT